MKLEDINLSFNKDWVEVEYEGYRIGLELGKEAKDTLGPSKVFLTTIDTALNMLMLLLGEKVEGAVTYANRVYQLPKDMVEQWVDKQIKACTPI